MVQFVGLLALLVLSVYGQEEKVGKTTRYWDCCKPSCSWNDKAKVDKPVETCDRENAPLADPNAKSGCDGGNAFMCASQQPWAINDTVAYGFAATKLEGQSETDWCCACYELTFTDTAIAGKKMIVQSTNTGGDLGANHFDLSMPGGGMGLFNGCTPQYGTPASDLGATYGGVASKAECAKWPKELQAGCEFRYDWFQNADNPAMKFKKVTCPTEITDKTGCKRTDE